ncbi:dUTPase [Staphylococcus chromogenes]|uniref:dUTPase n=1 Tax=Staphylococcus chromogenes TaxID=46126 RepID=UPI00288725D1|nr:dUTPase [Staphylococcus chromogenes]MDT0747148.1 dUTPase [Staphylococcus chromogenes]
MEQLTVDQLKELLQIQKEFDDRIPTLNLEDSKRAYAVEFFEWYNTLESFKNWKKRPGKSLDVQLDELADMLAFGLSITNQVGYNDLTFGRIQNYDSGLHVEIEKYEYNELFAVIDNAIVLNETIVFTFAIANRFYTVDQLIDAYKKKMEINHARQDGTADKEKGYV